MECLDLEAVSHDTVITAEEAERVVGWAFSEHLSSTTSLPPPTTYNPISRLAIGATSFTAAFSIHTALKVCLLLSPTPYARLF